MKFSFVGETAGLKKNPTVQRISEFLHRQPDGKLFTAPAVAAAMKINFAYFCTQRYMLPETLAARHGHAKLYGNPKTVAAWKKAHPVPD